jgi:hypothetical protein
LPSCPAAAFCSRFFVHAQEEIDNVVPFFASAAIDSKGIFLAFLAMALFAPCPSSAVLIATGDGTGNATAPADDPGWDNLGTRGNLSAIYLGNGWVMTANHVGIGPVTFGGQLYQEIPGSKERFENPDTSLADLIVFKIDTDPGLPSLTISQTTPSVNDVITMIGHGRNRGASTSWMGLNGFLWGAGYDMRWGTNKVTSIGEFELSTEAFIVTFDDIPPTPGKHEAGAASGDSGGGAFIKSGGNWELIGVLYAVSSYQGQPSSSTVEGNEVLIIDLALYYSAIDLIISQPDCDDGLDNDGDTFIDYPDDPGCDDADDSSELSVALPCDDGIDNDGDLLIDFGEDPDCIDPTTPSEEAPPPVPTIGSWGTALALVMMLAWHGARRAKR